MVPGEYADSFVVRVSRDYAFLTEHVNAVEGQHQTSEAAQTSLTILVMTETFCRSMWRYACESKGSSEQWVVDLIVEDIETIGFTSGSREFNDPHPEGGCQSSHGS